ncbi:MAG TPA: signal peptidase I [Planctomycetota bacterium]|nr:signal peptidase I [Planctomycetota bacterium]
MEAASDPSKHELQLLGLSSAAGALGALDATPLPSEAAPAEPIAAAEETEVGAEPATSRRRQARNIPVEVMILVLTALLLALTLKTYVADAYEIKGSSMLPTFHDGEKVVVLKSFYEVQRGDVIIFSSTEDPSKDLIKRVIGIPGDRVEIEGDRVWVNGTLLEESYVYEGRSSAWSDPKKICVDVGPNEYFVMGDNRGDSYDSRRFKTGPGVPAENLKGKVIVRWWPLEGLQAY